MAPDGSGPSTAPPTGAAADNSKSAATSAKHKENYLASFNDRGLAAPSAKTREEYMRSTWPQQPRSKWNIWHFALARLKVLPDWPGDKKPPVYKKGDPVPIWTMWQQTKATLPWAVLPVLAHNLFMTYTGYTLHPLVAYGLYTAVYNSFSLRITQQGAQIALKYGYFDGQHKRDGVPDTHVRHVFLEVLKVTLLRPLIGVFIAYNRYELPSFNILLLPIKMCVWSIVLDFWFYTYHTAMHKVPFLWRLHRKHHMTSHPSSLLSAFADLEQEIADAYLVPLATYAVLHPWFNFSEWFICTMFLVTAESVGHSGARMRAISPMSGWLLAPLGMELTLEHHDLHHRQGWSKYGKNMGKQTLLWDVIFGTAGPLIESQKQYVDFNWHVSLP